MSVMSLFRHNTLIYFCVLQRPPIQLQMHPFYYLKQVKIEPNETLHMSRPFESVYRNWKIDWKKYLLLITKLNCIRFKTNCLTMTKHVWLFLWVATMKKKIKMCHMNRNIIIHTPRKHFWWQNCAERGLSFRSLDWIRKKKKRTVQAEYQMTRLLLMQTEVTEKSVKL